MERLGLVMVLVLVPAIASWSRAAEPAGESDPTLDEILAQLHAWQTSFATIRVHSGYGAREHILARFPDLELGDDFLDEWRVDQELIWTDYGAYRFRHRNYEAGECVRSWMFGSDTRTYYSATNEINPGADEELWSEIFAHPETNDRPWTLGQPPLCGLWDMPERTWLKNLTSTGTLHIAGRSDVHGVPCVDVVHKWSDKPSIVLWALDPACGYLPRRISNKWNGAADPDYIVFYEVDAYQQLPGGSWFPRSGRYWGGSESVYEWTIFEVAMNEPYPPAALGPPRPTKGKTVMVDGSGRRTLWGATHEDVNRWIAEQAQRNVQALATENTAPIEATPERTIPWMWVLLGMAALSLIVGLSLRR